MQCIELDRDNVFHLHVNDWDVRSFGYVVSEVTGLRYTDSAIFKRIDQENMALGARLCGMRHDASDLRTRGDLQRNGFYVTENSCQFAVSLKRIRTSPRFAFIPSESRHESQLVDIATKQFHFGRFHEDPYVEADVVALRYANWIRSVVATERCLVTETQEGRVMGFFIFAQNEGEVDLHLAAVAEGYQGMGALLFTSIIDYLKPHGERLVATVSTANVAAMNTYISLGFRVRRSMVGFSKRYAYK